MLYADISSECGVYMAIESSCGKVAVKPSEDINTLTLSAALDYSDRDDECIFKTKLSGGQDERQMRMKNCDNGGITD